MRWMEGQEMELLSKAWGIPGGAVPCQDHWPGDISNKQPKPWGFCSTGNPKAV